MKQAALKCIANPGQCCKEAANCGMTATGNTTLVADEYSAVLGTRVDLDGVKIGRVKRVEGERNRWSGRPASNADSFSHFRTRARAIEYLVKVASR